MKKTLSRLPRVVRLAALSAVLLALCSKSSPLYAFNDWMDANIFFTMGRSMLGGRVLYRDVFDHKGPVLYLLYGLAGLVGGTDFRGVLVLEIIAMTSFLCTGLRTAELLANIQIQIVICDGHDTLRYLFSFSIPAFAVCGKSALTRRPFPFHWE